MKKTELFKKMLELQEANDKLMAEIHETDEIMRKIGFSDGLETVKAVAYDMCSRKKKKTKEDDLTE